MSKEVSKTYPEFFTLNDVYKAAWFWYGKDDINSCCLAENRLNKGEKL